MKIINWAIVIVLMVLPMYLILDFRTSAMTVVQREEDKYDAALRAATQDAAAQLNTNVSQEYEAGYGSEKYFRANKELALDTFYRSLYLNFGVVNDLTGQGTLNAYLPAIVVTDYDGYYLYVMTEYKGSDGQVQYKHTWRPKKPYAYSDQSGNTINFSLDGFVKVYQRSTGTWIEGRQVDLKGKTSVDLLNHTDQFEAKRREVIVSSIQQDLQYFINKHNQYASRNGISYIFTLPTIDQEEWTNTIDDIGIIAFLQGIPMGDQAYNNYALGSGRLVKTTSVVGAVDPDTGTKYAYNATCTFPYEPQEIFSNKKEAAAAGYFPKECVNGQK
ncbi:hypothetical protein [Paenibacillus kandeliae]|uniref:hypothetical protein n=1 Tax=Paenibacillus kandeliae TaxID=3231269 RepID=UPI003458E658